jgi:hypothetical protein
MADKKNKEQYAFNVVNFNKAESATPVEEVFGKDDWIKFGTNNDYPQEILRLFQNADGLHAALIKRKVDMIAGLGFLESSPLMEFLKNKYSKEDLNKISYKCAFDLVLFGGYYLNVVWDGAEGKQLAKIFHVPFEKVRAQKPQNPTGEITNYYISQDWLKCKKPENKPQLIPALDFEYAEKEKNKDDVLRGLEDSQLYFCKVYSPGMDYYCLPSYCSILNWLRLSFEISNFHLKSVQNGYMPGLVISVPHVPTPEEREKTAAELKARSGTDEANKTIVVYGESKDNMPEFMVLNPTTNDQKFRELIQQINEEIYIGHNSNNVIAGIAVAGKLGNSTEVKEQFNIFQKTVIAPLQNEIETSFNKLAEINGLPGELKLKTYTDYIDAVPTAPQAPGAAPAPDAAIEPPTQS